MELEILDVKKETPTTLTVKFKKNSLNYKAGQYLSFKLDVNDPKGSIRQFSIASSPTEDFLMISTRLTGSPFKEKLSSLLKGNKVLTTGPFGQFLLDENKDAVMLSGGIGITPLRAMIKYATDKKLKIKITLFFSNRTPEEIVYREELESWQKQNKNLKVINTITNIQDSKESWDGLIGYIDEKMIRENLNNFDGKIFYICGPPAMVDAMVNLLKSMNIDDESIRVEHFTGY